VSATFTDEQQELRSAAARFLDEKSSSEGVRGLIENESGYDEATWKQMAELGWLGIAIPEEFGGIGYTFVELAILLEEMGKRLLSAPFLSSAVFAAQAVINAGTDEQKKKLLPMIADGSARAALAFTEPSGRWDAEGITVQAVASDEDDYSLEGSKMYVIDGQSATHFIVAARTSPGPAGIGLFLVDGDQEGVMRKALDTLDLTRRQSKIDFSSAKASKLDGADGSAALSKTLDQAAVAMSAEMVGTAQRCLDMAVEYANTRIQFGRPIGSFQGVKHKCADMLTEVELARSAAYYGAWAATEEENELPVAACIAKAWCSDSVIDVAGKNIQIHGGIGFTWEHDAHLYFRRAKSQEIYLGDATYHRALLADRMGF
jgi:alkylation response protein AidB-like acyl-CoA dehydrogenase